MLTMTEYDHIRVHRETKEQLDQLKAPGQSYDGLLRELMALVKALLPMPPADGPPLPQGLGIRWPTREVKNLISKKREVVRGEK